VSFTPTTMLSLAAPARSPFAGSTSSPDVRLPTPTGGWALRLQDVTGAQLPSDLWMLAASDDTQATVLFDVTPAVPAGRRDTFTMISSNLMAHHTAELVTGTELPLIDFVSPGGDGPSAGLMFLVAYLDVATAGRFTNGWEVAGTGAIAADGNVVSVSQIAKKAVAAYATTPDVIVFPSAPATDMTFGFQFDSPPSLIPAGTSRFVARDWFAYASFGASAAAVADVGAVAPPPMVVVHHIGDLAAFLCGAGSTVACDLIPTFDTLSVPWPSEFSPAAVEAAVVAAAHDR
jgi:hypothetical protein